MKTKNILFEIVGIISLLLLTSCGALESSIGRSIGLAERGMQVANAYERQYRYYKAQSPYQRSHNGTSIVYAYQRSTTRSLSWYDTMVENRGGSVNVYTLRGGKKLLRRIPKGYHATYNFPVTVKYPYSGELDRLTLQIVTIPGNNKKKKKRGAGNLESYSMR